jgi:hypothetical protein
VRVKQVKVKEEAFTLVISLKPSHCLRDSSGSEVVLLVAPVSDVAHVLHERSVRVADFLWVTREFDFGWVGPITLVLLPANPNEAVEASVKIVTVTDKVRRVNNHHGRVTCLGE